MARRLLLAVCIAGGFLALGASAANASTVRDRIEQHRAEIRAKIECHRIEMSGGTCGAPAAAAPAPQQPAPQAAPSGSGKRIVISVSEQTLRAYEGDRVVLSTPVSTGAAGTPTPRGTFKVLSKETNHWSTKYGVWMPNAMRFTGGYFIHALPLTPDGRTIGAGSLGRPASHGCVRVGPDDAARLFAWASNGTPVIVQ